MSRYLLLHGAAGVGRSWSAVAAILREAGHEASAPDLPCTDPGAGLEAYVQAALAAAPGIGGGVVAGHSLGALTALAIAGRVPLAGCVLTCPLLPAGGRTLGRVMREEPVRPEDLERCTWRTQDGGFMWRRELAAEVVAGELPRGAALQAAAMLRPQAAAPFREPWPEDYAALCPVTAVVCRDDRVVSAAWAAQAARERFGAEVVELDGGHSPLEAQPAAVAEVLLRAAGLSG